MFQLLGFILYSYLINLALNQKKFLYVADKVYALNQLLILDGLGFELLYD